MAAVTEPLYAQRNIDLPPIEVEYTGGALDLTDATASIEVRLYQGAAGAALISKDGLAITDEDIATDADPDLRLLSIASGVTVADLTALPGLNTPEAGDSQTFWVEVKIHYGDGLVDSLWLAPFVVNPGVNTL